MFCRAHFPLYTEAKKLFNHSEGMVRAAVRMLTINVYSVQDTAMMDFVSSAPCNHYFHEVALHLAEHALHFDRHLEALHAGVNSNPTAHSPPPASRCLSCKHDPRNLQWTRNLIGTSLSPFMHAGTAGPNSAERYSVDRKIVYTRSVCIRTTDESNTSSPVLAW